MHATFINLRDGPTREWGGTDREERSEVEDKCVRLCSRTASLGNGAVDLDEINTSVPFFDFKSSSFLADLARLSRIACLLKVAKL